MLKFTKKITSIALSTVLALGMTTGAFASETNTVTNIQFNGTNIAFNDDKPVQLDNAVYAPFETTYKAFGADVTYDEQSKTYTAVKDSTKVVLSADSSTLTVVKNGDEKKESISGDLKTGYVPIRKAAETLNYSMGWDESKNTVIVIDKTSLTEKLADYSIMDKYLAYSKEFSNKSLALKGSFDLDYKIGSGSEMIPVTGTGTISALTDSEKVNLDMAMKLDVSKLATMTNTNKAELDQMSSMFSNIEMNFIMDLSTGKYYIQMPLLSTMMEQTENTWYMIDYNALFDKMAPGFSFTDLMAMTKIESFSSYMNQVIDKIPYTSVNDYTSVVTMIEMMNSLLSDTAFKKEGDTYKSNFTMTESGIAFNMSMSFVEKEDKITAYTMDISIKDPTMSMVMVMSQNGNTATAKIEMAMTDLLSMVMNMTMDYTETTEKPVSAPPSNSTILNVNDLFNSHIAPSGTPLQPAS